SSWLDYTINGLILGNVYALVAVGLALIFGVSRLINFAQGSIYLVGAYVGWVAVVALRTPLYITIVLVAAIAALVGLIIERFGLRPLQNSVRIAPLLATIGISFVLDQIVMLTFSPNPRALPSQLPDVRFQVGTGTIGPLDILIACIGVTSALLLLGLVESYGVAIFGTSYRNLFAFLLLILVLFLRPNGLFASAKQAPPEPLTGTFIAPSRPVQIPRWALLTAFSGFALLPLLPVSTYVLQT